MIIRKVRLGARKLVTAILGNPIISGLGLRFNYKQPLVLLYHGVSNQKNWSGIENYHGKHVPTEHFRQQLHWLKQHFTITTLTTIERLVTDKQKTKSSFCAITFDDGYQNNFLDAFPILQDERVPATIFLTGDFIDKGIPLWPDRLEFALNQSRFKTLTINMYRKEWRLPTGTDPEKISTYNQIRNYLKSCPNKERLNILETVEKKTGFALNFKHPSNYSPLSWTEVHTMSEAGIDFGAHTMSHPILGRLTVAEQKKEIIPSQTLIIQKLGSCRHFAYPNGQVGDWNDGTLKILESVNFTAAWTTIPRRVKLETDRALLLPRHTIAAYHDWNYFRALVSGLILS